MKLQKALSGLKAVAVLDKADSLNAAGGALFEDVTSGMYVNKKLYQCVIIYMVLVVEMYQLQI